MDNLPTRTNNPGDLKFIGQQGAQQDSSGFASFQSPKEGFGALLNDVQSKINKNPTHTLADFANTYAPPSDNNDSAQYAANLANKLNVPPNTPLSALQPKIGQFAEAIGSNEGYKDVNSNPNPSPQEVKDNMPTDPSSMSTWEKLLFGIPLVGGTLAAGALTGGAADAAIPEEVAALGGEAATEGVTAGEPGLLSKIGTGLKKAVTSKIGTLAEGVGLGDVTTGLLNKTFGGDSSKKNADEQASATEDAGTTEANATKEAEEASEVNNEDLADEKEVQDSLKAKEQSSQAYFDSLNKTAAGTKITQSPQGQMGIDSLTSNGVNPNINQEGRYETQVNQQDYSHRLENLDNKEQDLHSASGDIGDLDDVRREAKAGVRRDNRIPSTDWDNADKIIDERIDMYKTRMGQTPTLGRGGIGQVRADGYKSFDRSASTAQNAAGRALGNAANSHMLEKSSTKELIAGLHKEKEKLINGKKILKHLDGKKALENPGLIQRLLHGSGKYASLYIGDKLGGPIGAVIGDMVGKNIINAVDKRYGKNVFEKPAVRKALEMLHSKDPKIHAKVEKELKKYGVKMETVKKDLEHAKEMEQKRGEYKEKKKKVFEGESKNSEYDSYTEPGIINAGETPKKKAPADAISTDELSSPKVHSPEVKPIPLKKKRPELYEEYKEPGIINFGKSATPKKKKSEKGLLTIPY